MEYLHSVASSGRKSGPKCQVSKNQPDRIQNQLLGDRQVRTSTDSIGRFIMSSPIESQEHHSSLDSSNPHTTEDLFPIITIESPMDIRAANTAELPEI